MHLIDLTGSPSPVKQQSTTNLIPARSFLTVPPPHLPSRSPPPIPTASFPVQAKPPVSKPKLTKEQKDTNVKIDRLSKNDLRRLAKALVNRSPEALALAQGMLNRPKRPRDEVLKCENCEEGFKIDDDPNEADCWYHPERSDKENCYEIRRGKYCHNGDCGDWSCCADDLDCGYNKDGCTQGHQHEEMRAFTGVRL